MLSRVAFKSKPTGILGRLGLQMASGTSQDGRVSRCTTTRALLGRRLRLWLTRVAQPHGKAVRPRARLALEAKEGRDTNIAGRRIVVNCASKGWSVISVRSFSASRRPQPCHNASVATAICRPCRYDMRSRVPGLASRPGTFPAPPQALLCHARPGSHVAPKLVASVRSRVIYLPLLQRLQSLQLELSYYCVVRARILHSGERLQYRRQENRRALGTQA